MLGLLAAALLAAAGSPATGAPPTPPAVTIARPADADAVLQETTSRLRPELAAAGYGSQVATCAVDPMTGPTACPRDQTLAIISLARANGTTSIFVTSRLQNGRELHRHVQVEAENGGGDATLLAVRAVELLRDLQLEVAQVVAEDDEDPQPLEQFKEPSEPTPQRIALIGGASTLFVDWTNRPGLAPAIGGLLGLGMRFGQHVMAVIDGAGPFAAQVPAGAPETATMRPTQRPAYRAIGRVGVRIGRRSPLEGPFATFFAGASYLNVQLDTLLSSGSGQVVSPLAGVGIGYTARVTPSLAVSATLDVAGTTTVKIQTKTGGTLTESSYVWMAVNLTASLAVH